MSPSAFPLGLVLALLALGSLWQAFGQTGAKSNPAKSNPAAKSPAPAPAAASPTDELTALNRKLKTDPNNFRLYVTRGKLRATMEDEPGAIADFERSLWLNPEYTPAYVELGKLHATQGAFAKAVATFDRGLREAEGSGWAVLHLQRGIAVRALGRTDDALADFKRALELDPKLAEARARAVETERRRGRLEAAELLLAGWLAADPNDAEFYFQRGMLRCAQGKRQMALADLDQTVARDRNGVSKYRYHRGALRQAMGLASAEEFTAARSLDPQKQGVQALVDAASAAQREAGSVTQLKEAAAAYARVLAADADAWEVYLHRGEIRQRLADYEGALADYTAALRLLPGWQTALRRRAALHAALGHDADAIRDHDALVAAKPTVASRYFERAKIREIARRADTFADLDRAIELSPKNPEYLRHRGWLRLTHADHEGAIADFSAIITLRPNDAGAHESRGNAHLLARHWSDALADYRRALEIDPSPISMVRLHVWLLRGRMDERARGQQELAAAVDATRASPDVDGRVRIAHYLTRRMDEEAFIKPYESAFGRTADGHDTLCIASYFAGMRNLLDGHRAAAIEWLQQAVHTGASNLLHYHAAESELRQLKALSPRLGLPPRDTPPEKIMVFSFDRVNAGSDAFKIALAQYQAEDAEQVKAIEKWQAEIASLKTELERATKARDSANENARAAAEKTVAARREALSRKEQAFVGFVQDVSQSLNKRSLELAAEPNALVVAAARAYAAEKGFEYICDATGPTTSGVPLLPLGMKGTDVTAVLIERVNAPGSTKRAEDR